MKRYSTTMALFAMTTLVGTTAWAGYRWGSEVVIDDAASDLLWIRHHTPATYGLRSYVSVPIILPDGEFFGTLCAIDPKPARVNRLIHRPKS